MKIPQKWQTSPDGLFCKIFKSLNGLKQEERLWNKTIKFFWKIGFISTNADLCILIFRKDGRLIVVDIYVDNIILAANCKNVIQ